MNQRDIATFDPFDRDYSRMQFGKYKNKLLADVPLVYLRWAAEQADCPDLNGRDAMRAEINRRKH